MVAKSQSALDMNPASGNQYLLGESVRISTETMGDVFAIGGSFLAETIKIDGDVFGAAKDVQIDANVADDTFVIGLNVAVNSIVAGDVGLAGREVRVGPQARIIGLANLAGEDVYLNGTFESPVKAVGKRVFINGTLKKGASIEAKELIVGKKANIKGGIQFYTGDNLRVDDRAQLEKPVERIKREWDALEEAEKTEKRAGIVILLWPALAGLVLILFVPRMVTAAAGITEANPWRSLGIGLGMLVGVPVVAVMLIVSVVGMPFGFSLFAAWPVMMLVGLALGSFWLGDRFLGRKLPQEWPTRARRLLVFIVGLSILYLCNFVPYVGWLAPCVTLLMGMGALGTIRYRQTRTFT